MALFFQIIGSIFIAIIVIIVAFYFFIKIKFKGLIKLAENEVQTPMVIHLNESYDTEWLTDDDAVQLSQNLVRLGFEKGNVYDVIGMNDVSLQAFFKEGVSAVLYTYPAVGNWVDMVYLGKSGEEVTVTNAISGSEIDTRPECIKVHMTGAHVSELLQRLETESKDMTPSEVNADNFRSIFELSYQKDMAFMANKGGITRAEFMKVYRNNPVDISDENLENAFLDNKLQEIEQWHDAVFNAHDFDDGDAIYFIIPDNVYIPALLQYLSDYDVIPERAVEPISQKHKNAFAPQLFQKINKGFSEKLRAKEVKTLSLPLKATVYSKPYS